ncbi:MAG TPA: indole-3-glycerol phosphate synthase TrpC [Gemmataceae bacterium]|nr:indole-3-glycerol phosphate synthase TrpC [Gemmataceae bacterium]
MSSILDRIVSYKRQEIAAARARTPDTQLEEAILRGIAPTVRDFRAALERESGVAIIAEVKRASPSAGLLRADFDPVAIARIYEQNGTACISVLTDEPSFQGHLHYLKAIRNAVSLPLLCKDFILDRHQLLEARLAGADAVLLIAEILNEAALPRLLREAVELGMQTLVELYDRANLPRVLDSGARLIGVNNRNLHTFQTRLEHTLDLIADLPPNVCLVSESGVHSRGDIERLQASGVRAVLIGETFMRAADIAAKLRELRGVEQTN